MDILITETLRQLVTALAAIFLVVALLGSLGAVAVWRLMRPEVRTDFDADWLEAFSAAKYRPMMRLLSADDYEFLAVQPGFTAEVAKRLRSERRRIFRTYLRNLVADFEKLYSAGQVIVTYSAADRSELAAVLFRQRVHFYGALMAVHCRLVLHTLGVSRIEVAPLIQSLDRMRLSLDNMMAGQAIGANA